MGIDVKIKRVYDDAGETDGMRILVDRLWPRGIRKDQLNCDMWAKEITPSPALRSYFHDAPDDHWTSFAERYREELEHSDAFNDFIGKIKENAPKCVTLLYAYKNMVKNHAIILQQEIIKKLNS